LRRILFVCARNRLRSPTAEAIFASVEGIEAISAGTASDAECQVSRDLIEWADEIYVMEPRQKKLLLKRFGGAVQGKSLVSLGIPDRYTYMQPELVALLKVKLAHVLDRV